MPSQRSARLARCPHCEALVEGPEDTFCCHGCEQAYTLLHELDLDSWYANRAEPGNSPQPTAFAWDTMPVQLGDDGANITLAIDGLRCTSCTWVVERVLERTPGVTAATVSYASGRAKLSFDPEQTDLKTVADRIASLGYAPRPVDAATGPSPLFKHFGVAVFGTANLMLLTAAIYAGWAHGMEERFQVLFRWGALVLATPIAMYSAEPFWQGAWQGLINKRIGMDVPIAIGIAVLYGHGLIATFMGADAYLDSLGMLVTLLLFARIIDARGRQHTADAAAAVAARLPQVANRRTETGVEQVEPRALVPGDVVELGPGAELPADVVITEGSVLVQTSMLTGESEPTRVEVGGLGMAGCMVLDGTAAGRVERAGAATTAMGLAEALRDAIDRPVTDNPADELAPWFTGVTILIAAITGAAWTATTGLTAGIEVAVAVLVVACPCALGLSVPLSVSQGLGALARRGLLLRDGDALLRLAEVQQLAIDKTGTLTEGSLTVTHADDEVLRIAAGLERASHHPIARAICAEASERALVLPLPSDIQERAGIGVQGRWQDAVWSLRSAGAGAVQLRRNDKPVGLIQLSDHVRTDADVVIGALSEKLPVTLLSGDTPSRTRALADQLGIADAHGGLLPDEKAAWIEAHPRTLFVGDGLNDGPALKRADVGLAMHTGLTASLGVADGVVTSAGLEPVWLALEGAHATRRTIRRNLARSVMYNVVAVGAASAGLINPLIAALLMPLSSLLVAWGAMGVERELTAAEARWTSS